MSRTRIVFFVILGLYVAVVAVSLVSNLAGIRFLSGLFIASTVFSVGVVLLDFLGIFEGHHGDMAGDVTAGHVGGDGDMIGGHGDLGHAGEASIAGHAHVTEAAPGHEAAEPGHDVGHDVGHDDGHDGEHPAAQHQGNAAPILSALTYLRLFVYFCLGFGPVGWISLATGRSPLISLLAGAAVGVLAVFLAQAFFRFQRHDTDSQLKAPELVGQRATVIVPLDDKTMGRVRVQVGLMVTEQYALAARSGASFVIGEEVVVTTVTDECVYVR